MDSVENDSIEKIVADMRVQAAAPSAILGPLWTSNKISSWADRLAAIAPAGVGEDEKWLDDLKREVLWFSPMKSNFTLTRDELAHILRKLEATARPDSVSEAAEAARYRWLKANGKPAAEGLAMRKPEHWDAAIDAALEAARAKGGVSHD